MPHISLLLLLHLSINLTSSSSSSSSTMMITLCKKTLHTFLGISDDTTTTAYRSRTSPSSPGGLILIAADCRKSPNVLESSALKPNSPSLKKDPGGGFLIGSLDEIHNNSTCGNGGLSSCTESLGFESSEYQAEDTIDCYSSSSSSSSVKKKTDDDIIDDDDYQELCWRRKKRSRERLRWREEVRNRELPPPLSSFNQNGKSSFFLKPVRANGRLVLTEVKIHRPEIFQASRQDGRLRLRIASAGSEFESESKSEKEPVAEEAPLASTSSDAVVSHEEEEMEGEEKEERGGIAAESESGRTWQIPARVGEGFRRCHELINHHNHHHHRHHHHNHLPLWNHQCVTTR